MSMMLLLKLATIIKKIKTFEISWTQSNRGDEGDCYAKKVHRRVKTFGDLQIARMIRRF